MLWMYTRCMLASEARKSDSSACDLGTWAQVRPVTAMRSLHMGWRKLPLESVEAIPNAIHVVVVLVN